MFSIYIIYVYIRGVWGVVAPPPPQKPTTHYKNKIKWRLFLYCEPGYFFSFSQARPGYFFCSFQRQIILFSLFRDRLFVSFKTRDRNLFWKITQPPRISNGRPLKRKFYKNTKRQGDMDDTSGWHDPVILCLTSNLKQKVIRMCVVMRS